MPQAHRKREPERIVPTPPDLDTQLVTDGKIVARLVAVMAGLFVFGVIALNAGFFAAAVLCLLAAPAVLVTMLLWYKKGGALEREQRARDERRKKADQTAERGTEQKPEEKAA